MQLNTTKSYFRKVLLSVLHPAEWNVVTLKPTARLKPIRWTDLWFLIWLYIRSSSEAHTKDPEVIRRGRWALGGFKLILK